MPFYVFQLYYESVKEISLLEIIEFYKNDWHRRFTFFDYSYNKNYQDIQNSIKNVLEKVTL